MLGEPNLQSPSDTSMGIAWTVNVLANGWVEYADNPEFANAKKTVCGGFGGINEAAVAVAERTVVRGNPRHRIQVWILEGVRIDGGACPVVARPDEDALHVVVPCLP